MYRTMMDPYERGGGGGPMPAVGGLGGGRAGVAHSLECCW